MSWLLNILYSVGLLFFSPRMLWRYLVLKKNRRGWSQKLWGNVPERAGDCHCVWIHAVSVGEVNLLTGFVSRLRSSNPSLDIVISTSTETGFDLATQKFPDHMIFFCPLDFSWAVNNVLRRIRPDVLMLTELELWPNLISCAKQKRVSVMVANARLSESSFRGYRRFKFLFSKPLSHVDFFAVQNQAYADRFVGLGVDSARLLVSGNMKFDNAIADRHNAQTVALKSLLDWRGSKIFLAGSTQAEEDDLVVSVFKRISALHPTLKMIVAPRHMERCSRLAQRITLAGLTFEYRSSLVGKPVSSATQILIVDVIGELSFWWGVADVAYVGGSMGPREGQNMIEPAAFGLPVSFGPRTKNFRSVVAQLLENNAATVISDENELAQFLKRNIENHSWGASMGARASHLVACQQGANERTIQVLEQLLKNRKSRPAIAA